MAPEKKVLICGMLLLRLSWILRAQSSIGDLVWAHDEARELFSGLAEVLVMDCKDRKSLLQELARGGRFHGIVGVYRHNVSADHVGMYVR